jgi:hypothetical protein
VTIHKLNQQRQQRGEIERHLEIHGDKIHIVTVTPDRVRTVDILTAEQACEWSDELRDAAAEVMAADCANEETEDSADDAGASDFLDCDWDAVHEIMSGGVSRKDAIQRVRQTLKDSGYL